jgi:hypothetical protein
LPRHRAARETLAYLAFYSEPAAPEHLIAIVESWSARLDAELVARFDIDRTLVGRESWFFHERP